MLSQIYKQGDKKMDYKKNNVFLLFFFNEMTFVHAAALWLDFLQKNIITYAYLAFATQGTHHLGMN